jgi:hypothetical protein
MGRLAGYKYREIVKRLKALGLTLMKLLAGIRPFPIILVTCPRERFERSSGRPESKCRIS